MVRAFVAEATLAVSDEPFLVTRLPILSKAVFPADNFGRIELTLKQSMGMKN
ncbi:MAG TPA: hypothetical protein VL918_13925 [Sphingobium sp.]|nr:hypothetical protein [Sphingobium sp.]